MIVGFRTSILGAARDCISVQVKSETDFNTVSSISVCALKGKYS